MTPDFLCQHSMLPSIYVPSLPLNRSRLTAQIITTGAIFLFQKRKGQKSPRCTGLTHCNSVGPAQQIRPTCVVSLLRRRVDAARARAADRRASLIRRVPDAVKGTPCSSPSPVATLATRNPLPLAPSQISFTRAARRRRLVADVATGGHSLVRRDPELPLPRLLRPCASVRAGAPRGDHLELFSPPRPQMLAAVDQLRPCAPKPPKSLLELPR
jgi:hypothetical protein